MRSNNYMLDGAILQSAYEMSSQSVAKTSLGVDGIKEFKPHIQFGLRLEF